MQFAQFAATKVSLDVAALIVGGDSSVLKALASKERFSTNEYLLSTGAKLIWMEDSNEFAIFSYSHDGSDGQKAYFDVVGARYPCPDHGYLHHCSFCQEKYVGEEVGGIDIDDHTWGSCTLCGAELINPVHSWCKTCRDKNPDQYIETVLIPEGMASRCSVCEEKANELDLDSRGRCTDCARLS